MGDVMKKILNFIISFVFLSMVCSCTKNSNIVEEAKFKKNVDNLLKLIDYNEVNQKYYYIMSGRLLSYSNNQTFDTGIDVNGYNIDDIGLKVNSNGNARFIILSKKYCAVKDYNDEDYKVYPISDNKNCYKNNYFEDSLNLNINYYFYDNKVIIYIENDLLILKGTKYIWYKDDKKIKNDNPSIVVDPDDDSVYYVKLKLKNGEEFKTKKFRLSETDLKEKIASNN